MAYSLRAYEYWMAVYRRVWRGTIVTSVLNPVLYLSALGIGLGKLVNNGANPLGIPYLDFVAPGMLLDTISAIWFPVIFPNIRPAAAGAFGGWLLFCNVVVLLTAVLYRPSPRATT